MAEVAAISLDIGRKRIGVAGCDRLGLLASPIATIERQSFEQDVAALRAIAQERQATVLVAGLPATGHRVAFVFGPERTGLANDDVYRCHQCLSIPADAAYGSLNLAQAVQVIAYEWRQALGGFAVQPRTVPPQWADVARSVVPSVPGVTLGPAGYRTMGAEDMAFILDALPGVFFFLGAGNPAVGAIHPHHHPSFEIDEAALPMGVAMLSEWAVAALERLAR